MSSYTLKQCPCKGCAERYAGCHPTCGKYKSWRELHITEARTVIKKKTEAGMYLSYRRAQASKNK